MSFKGIAWAGNVYEKFEAMCLEVEEAVYQDTVKYMENQVQKVSVSVKKFCSEVMDDLRPISCVDPTGLDSSEFSHFPNDFPNVKKKPIQKKENEEQVFSPQSPGIFIENIEKSGATKRIGMNRRPIGIKRISRNNPPSEESSLSDRRRTSSRLALDNKDATLPLDSNRRSEHGEAVKGNTPIILNPIKMLSSESARKDASVVARDGTNLTSSSGSNRRSEHGEVVKGSTPIIDNSIKMLSSESAREDTSMMARDGMNVTSSSYSNRRPEHGEVVKGNTPIIDNSIKKSSFGSARGDASVVTRDDTNTNVTSSSDIATPILDNVIESPPFKKAESLRQMEDASDCISNNSDNKPSDERLKEDQESTSSCSGLHSESTGTSMKDGSNPRDTDSGNKDLIASEGTLKMDDSFDMEFVENEEITEPRNQFETSGKVKLEESCILVEGDELSFAIQETWKHKSYKKRIRAALSSKMKSRNDDKFASQSRRGEKEENLSAQDSVESDWEIL